MYFFLAKASYLTGMQISRDCFANFVADFRTIFVRVSHECRENNFHVSRTSRELVVVLTMFKNFMRFFFAKIFRKTVVRRSVARTFRREILVIYNAEFSRHSYECRARLCCVFTGRATVLRKHADTSRPSGEKIKLSDIQCRATLSRMSGDCRTNENENKLHSRERYEIYFQN